jgi:hypothetical protein
MNIKDQFLSILDVLEGMGKEVFSFIVLTSGLILLCKGLLTGQQFTDVVKAIGVAYIGGCVVGNTGDSILAHLKERAQAAIKEKL